MSDREFFGTFSRKGYTYRVEVQFDPELLPIMRIEYVFVSCCSYEIEITPHRYDKTNKLHVNAFIVIVDSIAERQEDCVVDDFDWTNFPTDPRLAQEETHGFNI